MEINTQQMEALLHLQEQQAGLPRKQGNAAGGFEALLTREIEGTLEKTAPVADNALTGAALYNNIMLNQASEAKTADPDAAVLQSALDQASFALDKWDDYAKTLGHSASNSNLRSAWNILEGLDNQLGELRQNPIAGKNAVFDDILNELEVLSATEKFKFNRGDYFI